MQDELVGGPQETRNWGGIVISLLVIIIICTLIVITAVIVSPRMALTTKYAFEDIFDESFVEKSFDAQWLDDFRYARLDVQRNIMLYDVTSDVAPRQLVHRRIWDNNHASRFFVSPDLEYVLLVCKRKKLYRISEFAVYKIFSIRSQVIVDSLSPVTSLNPEAEMYLRYAGWAPRNSSLVFVDAKNDVYYKESVMSGNCTRLTDTGRENLVFNGVPDWVYEEDVLHSDNAIYWYDDGSRFVYATFDDTKVQSSWIPVYGYQSYPELNSIPYPLPNYPLPVVQLYFVNLNSTSPPVPKPLSPPKEILNMKEYLYKYVVWVNESHVAITWLNRVQNHSIISLCDTNNGSCNQTLYEEEEENGWVILRGPPVFSSSGNKFATISKLSIDRDDDFYHAFVLTLNQKPEHRQIYTEGRFEVIKILAFKGEDTLYYLANKNASWNRHLYSTQRGLYKTLDTTCLSCGVNENCTFFDATFLPNSDKYLLFCKGWTVPMVTLHSIGDQNFTVLEDNSELATAVYNREHIVQTWDNILIDDRVIPVRLLKSNTWDPNRKHPFLVNIYGGPESQKVTSQFYEGWFTYLASKYHFLIAEIDTRGAAYTGHNHMMSVYKKLGQYEIEDLVDVVSYLKSTNGSVKKYFPDTLIDNNQVAAVGWSTGGFLSSLLQSRSDVFNCSIAVAPVTDWRHYSSVYTERYMGLPTASDNFQGYQESNVSAEATKFRNSSLFLVHGMADRNVHFQHSANLISALLQANVDHKTMLYPKDGHFLLEDPRIRMSLYRKMTDFLLQCFDFES